MKFIVDECVGPSVVHWLKNSGYDATSVYNISPGINDLTVLKLSISQKRILITSDKGFGEMIFKERKKHCGIILLRLTDERPSNKTKIIKKIIDNHGHEIEENFIVATEKTIRVSIPAPLH